MFLRQIKEITIGEAAGCLELKSVVASGVFCDAGGGMVGNLPQSPCEHDESRLRTDDLYGGHSQSRW